MSVSWSIAQRVRSIPSGRWPVGRGNTNGSAAQTGQYHLAIRATAVQITGLVSLRRLLLHRRRSEVIELPQAYGDLAHALFRHLGDKVPPIGIENANDLAICAARGDRAVDVHQDISRGAQSERAVWQIGAARCIRAHQVASIIHLDG